MGRLGVLIAISLLWAMPCSALYSEVVFIGAETDRNWLQSRDFSEQVRQLESEGIMQARGNDTVSAYDLLVEDLSEWEELLLSRYYVSDRHVLSCSTIAMRAINVARSTGKLPACGMGNLLLYSSDLLTSEGTAQLRTLSPEQQLKQVYIGINPVTGRFYSSFVDPEWQAFGMYIEQLTGEEGVEKIPFESYNHETGERQLGFKEYQGWRIVLFGELEGRVLVDKVVWTELGNEVFGFTGSCGCKANS